MSAYDKDGNSYSEISCKLSKEFTEAVKELIPRYMNDGGMSIEDIQYVVINDIQRLTLKEKIKQRCAKTSENIKENVL